MSKEVTYHSRYETLFKKARTRYRIITGGRGSGKSYAISSALVNDTYKADFLSYINEMQAKFISGEVDVDNDGEWQKGKDNLNLLGLPELMEAHQSLHDRLK